MHQATSCIEPTLLSAGTSAPSAESNGHEQEASLVLRVDCAGRADARRMWRRFRQWRVPSRYVGGRHVAPVDTAPSTTVPPTTLPATTVPAGYRAPNRCRRGRRAHRLRRRVRAGRDDVPEPARAAGQRRRSHLRAGSDSRDLSRPVAAQHPDAFGHAKRESRSLLALADEHGLLADVEYTNPTNVADAPDTVVEISADGRTYTHRAYALGINAETDPSASGIGRFRGSGDGRLVVRRQP